MIPNAQRREAMIASQLRPSKVSDPRTIAAFRKVAREAFVPADRQALAYADEDIQVAPGRVLLEPLTIARLIGELRPQPGERILALGGIGYGAAVLAAFGAEVTHLEETAALAEVARKGLAANGADGVTLVKGPLKSGWAKGAPYDAILVEGAMGEIPPALIAQLAPDGRLSGLLAEGSLCRAVLGRKAGDAFGLRPFMDAFAPILPGFEKAVGFTF